ncbi:sugar phosphate isomerase/epimerase [soil metagenome]
MRLSVQLYTLRDDLAKDVAGTLAKVRMIGFEYVELAGYYDLPATEWKTILDDLELKVSGAHTGIEAFENDYAGTVADLKLLGVPYAIIPYLSDDRRSDYAGLGAQLDALGARLSEDGLKLAYHNHDFEFVNDGLSTLYSSTAPENLQAELDLAWVKIGGQDPVEWITKMAGRLPLVHLKDYDPAKSPQWVPAGQGVMPFDAIIAAANAAGVEFGVVELDAYSGDPIDAVEDSYAFLSPKVG